MGGRRKASDAHPLAILTREVALVLGGQNPNTPEYQIYPPVIDTLVTGMTLGTSPEAPT